MFAQTRDAIPRVLLLGRLALYGPGAAVSMKRSSPLLRGGSTHHPQVSLVAVRARGGAEDAGTLEKALLSGGHTNETIETMLRNVPSARDIEELLPHLHHRGEEYAKDAMQKLQKRGG